MTSQEPRGTSQSDCGADVPVEGVAVAVIGGGPSGLTAAAELARRVEGKIRVIEREHETGGIPRHSHHRGYGIRDRHRFMSGPAYARRLTDTAREAGAELDTEAQVTGWAGDRRLLVTSPRGRHIVRAEAVVLATGARERPRPARLIAGDRPDGVYTTGQLQNLVHLHQPLVGTRAVIAGAELVSWSALMTLREAGCRTVAMTSTYAHSEAYAAFRLFGRLALRTPVLARTRIVGINGKDRVESVIVEHLDSGKRAILPCDTVITTGDWIPDNELVRLAGISLDRATLGPVVDSGLRTKSLGIFAVGNLVHPVDTADSAALDGRHVAAEVQAHLQGRTPPSRLIEVTVSEPFRWVTPQLIVPNAVPPRGDLLLWADCYQRLPLVHATQDGRVLARKRLPWPAAPGRIFRVPASLVSAADPAGGPVSIGLDQPARVSPALERSTRPGWIEPTTQVRQR